MTQHRGPSNADLRKEIEGLQAQMAATRYAVIAFALAVVVAVDEKPAGRVSDRVAGFLQRSKGDVDPQLVELFSELVEGMWQ